MTFHRGVREQGDCDYTGWPVTGFSPAFLGALIGSLIRPVGGVMSDKWGGARVTHYHTVLITIVSLALGFIVKVRSPPELPLSSPDLNQISASPCAI